MKSSSFAKIVGLALMAFTVLAWQAAPAEAYRVHGRGWHKSKIPVPYHVNTRGLPYGLEVVNEAAYKWGNNKQFEFAFKYQGTTNRSSNSSSMHVVRMSNSMNMGILGLTWYNYSRGYLNNIDIAFNGRTRWSRKRFLNVAIHEFGHALGLSHSQYGAAIMNASGGVGDKLTELHRDDVAGAKYLYPPTGNPDRPWGDQGAPFGKPEVIAPQGNVENLRPTFSWKGVEGAEGYEVALDRVGSDSKQIKLVRTGTLSDTSWTHSSQLEPGSYFWWVRATKGDAKSGWAHAKFTVTWTQPLPGKVTIVAPQGKVSTTLPTFSWNAASDATHYEVALDVVDPVGKQTKVLRTGPITGTSFTPDAPLEQGYYLWWVRARNERGEGEWAWARFTIEVDVPAPGKPAPLEPQGTVSTREPVFTWSEASDAAEYELVVHHIDESSERHEIIRAAGVEQTSFTPPTGMFEPGTTYHWWIRARNAAGNGEWSQHAKFDVAEDAPDSDPDGDMPEDVPVEGEDQPGDVADDTTDDTTGDTPGDDTPLGKTTLLAPTGTIGQTSPAFTWSAVPGATHYELRVDLVGGGGKVVHEQRVEGTSHSPAAPLYDGSDYHWWVRPFRGDQAGEWSAGAFKVELEDPSAPPSGGDVPGGFDDVPQDTDRPTVNGGGGTRGNNGRCPRCNGYHGDRPGFIRRLFGRRR